MRLTKQAIATVMLPTGKTDHIVFDEDLPGFGLRIRAGKRTWIIQYRAGHKQRRETLGDVRKLDADMARKEAKRRLAMVELGRDPQAERIEAKARAKLTLGPIADKYLAIKRPVLRPSSHQATERYLTKHWAPLRGVPVHKIEREDIASRLTEISTQYGTTSALRARAALSAFYSWAMGEGLAKQNPVIGTNKPGEPEARDRVLRNHEVAAIWQQSRNDDFGRVTKLLILLGARKGEISGLRWDEVDLDRGIISLPRERTKNRRPHTISLPPLALSIVEAIPRRESRELIFGLRDGPFSGWGKAKEALDARITAATGKALPAWRIHDLRRTCATGMAELGVQPHIVEAVLNHVSGHKAGVAGIYNRASYEREVKVALALWADHVRSLVEGTERKVVPLRG